MKRTKENEQPEVADIFRLYGEDYRQYNPVSYEQRKALHHIEVCRTAELGGHVEQCDQCAFDRISYNSCRDRKQNETREMTVDADEFIRRFLLHVLPKGFMKIRYFGFLANKNKKKAIPILRKLIDPEAKLPEKIKETIQEMMLRLAGTDITCCPKCKKGKMIIIRKLPKPDRTLS